MKQFRQLPQAIIFGICIMLLYVAIYADAKERRAIANQRLLEKADSLFNDSTMFKNSEQMIFIEQTQRYALSAKGKDFIKSQETCKLTAYNDPDRRRRSVGWGHQIQPGEKLDRISQKKADELFEKDIEWVNDAINRLISKNDKRFAYSQGFIDGLGDLIYNCGERGVTLTEFWERWQRCRYDKNHPARMNQNDFNFMVAAVKNARISAPGHISRRYDVHKMMLD